jgi:hypothetical protein
LLDLTGDELALEVYGVHMSVTSQGDVVELRQRGGKMVELWAGKRAARRNCEARTVKLEGNSEGRGHTVLLLSRQDIVASSSPILLFLSVDIEMFNLLHQFAAAPTSNSRRRR